jgi:hypothetical protein
MTLYKNSSQSLLSGTQLLPTFPLFALHLTVGKENFGLAPTIKTILPSHLTQHPRGKKECSATIVMVSSITGKGKGCKSDVSRSGISRTVTTGYQRVVKDRQGEGSCKWRQTSGRKQSHSLMDISISVRLCFKKQTDTISKIIGDYELRSQKYIMN